MKRIHFLFYRYRYLLIYILFGITSLLVELIFLKFFLFYKFPFYLSTILAFLLGLMTAFFLNVKLNWRLNGSIEQIKESNSKSVGLASDTMKTISLYLPNKLQFCKI